MFSRLQIYFVHEMICIADMVYIDYLFLRVLYMNKIWRKFETVGAEER